MVDLTTHELRIITGKRGTKNYKKCQEVVIKHS